jgi:alpha-galactosidase
MGCHVGPPTAHTTGRVAELPLRAATALFGHAGLEWDLTTLADTELAELAGWIALHKRLRPLLHTGDVVRADHPDPASWLHGVVAADRGHAVFAYVRLSMSLDSVPAALRFPGLDPQAAYQVRALPELLPTALRAGRARQPGWLRGEAITVPGAVLAGPGLSAPALHPATALVFELTRAAR